ncbi:MAG: hypothetical protein AUG89_08025 [Acidobacteria bacterium 13_1_20CM_4_56_7]|nr:MAG: hypothetical protein AUG89_08025 [Acidobacteria bacterium 13_1_20CM_4_56_7]
MPIKLKQRAKMLGACRSIQANLISWPLKIEFMQRINSGNFSPHSSMNLREFGEKVYLPYIEELRASTKKRISGNLDQSYLRPRWTYSFAWVQNCGCQHDAAGNRQ